MTLLKELFEMAKAGEFTSGFTKSRKAAKLASDFKRGRGTFELSDGRTFKGAGTIDGRDLKKGDIVLASYNQYNQGAQLYEILGVTSGEGGHADEKVTFASVQDALDHYGVEELEELEEAAPGSVRLVVKDLEDGDSGAWFYIFENEWVRGSGAEALTFTRAVEVKKVKEARYDEGPHFGLEDSGNAVKAERALKTAKISFKSDSNAGITYFYFDNREDLKKAVAAVKKVIDSAKESEW